jgi:hypothetical protein
VKLLHEDGRVGWPSTPWRACRGEGGVRRGSLAVHRRIREPEVEMTDTETSWELDAAHSASINWSN